MLISKKVKEIIKVGRCDVCNKFSLGLVGIWLIPWKRRGNWKFIMACKNCSQEIAPEDKKNKVEV